MLNSIVRFTDDTQGLEKTLRLLQGFCTIAVGLITSAEDAEFWVKTRSQFALGRRYFRLLKWHPCWASALEATNSAKQPLITALEVTKWSFLGMYFFLEMFTISNAMGVTTYEWGPTVQREANRCWFISLVLSILLSLHGLWSIAASGESSKVIANGKPRKQVANGVAKGPNKETTDGVADEKIEESTHEKSGQEAASKSGAPDPLKTKLYTQLIIDSCDLFIPGAAIGWIPAGPTLVGTLSTVSTTLAGRQLWKRVQERAQQA